MKKKKMQNERDMKLLKGSISVSSTSTKTKQKEQKKRKKDDLMVGRQN